MKFVAFIPARSGSKRVPDKNIRSLGGHPVLAYSIVAARQSGVFDAIMVSTDSADYAEIARHYGAEVPFLRPKELAGDHSTDFEWIEFTLARLRSEDRNFEGFGILRPTSPFRQPETIRRAWNAFHSQVGVDSLRAVEKCSQHPGKMWVVRGARMLPVLPFSTDGTPWHSMPYQALPEIYIQNASLELAWSRVVMSGQSISGDVIMPFLTQGFEGFDINHPRDWQELEGLVKSGYAKLPEIDVLPYSSGRS